MKTFHVYLIGHASPTVVKCRCLPSTYNGNLEFSDVAHFQESQVTGWHCVDEIDTSRMWIGFIYQWDGVKILCSGRSETTGLPEFRKEETQ